jgi:hypothetical protein
MCEALQVRLSGSPKRFADEEVFERLALCAVEALATDLATRQRLPWRHFAISDSA